MTLSIATADLRATFLREMHRLSARPMEGGPALAIRKGVLLAWMPCERETIVDDDLLAVLARLPSGAGVDAVAGVLA